MAEPLIEAVVPLRLTHVQRKIVAQLLPALSERLLLDSKNQRTLSLPLAAVSELENRAKAAIQQSEGGLPRNSLCHIIEQSRHAINQFQTNDNSSFGVVYQFKIALLDIKPSIWRRIQVPDVTLDQLHEHIQTAMGWTNSHLHQFEIGGRRYGDPELLDDGYSERDFSDSTTTRLSSLLAKKRRSFRFLYEYDFGDGWQHEIVYEGSQPAEAGQRYPRCIEGARACPPEDVGGPWGYEDFLDAIKEPTHENHKDILEWIGGRFDPEEFSAAAATKEMRRGLPNWRDFR